MVLQQFGGINAICFYASSIFEVAGKEDRITQSLELACCSKIHDWCSNFLRLIFQDFLRLLEP